MGAAAAAAVILRKEREIVAAFRAAAATSPAAAMTLAALNVHGGVALRRLQRRAIIREASADHFYLDEPSWDANVWIRRRLALVAVVVAVILLGYTWLLATRLPR